MRYDFAATLTAALFLLTLTGCDAPADGRQGPPRERGGGPPSAAAAAAVPVETAPVLRESISTYIESNGALEAENEVDIVARISAPVVELRVEEGDVVRRGQLVARLDEEEIAADLEISRVTLREAELAYERAKRLMDGELISVENFERSRADWEGAVAQLRGNEIRLSYTRVHAPFDGAVVTRYVDPSQQVGVNEPLFRISDFTPLLCRVRLPERELSRLSVGQRAHLTVEPWPDRRFDASILRISPVVDPASGTIKVTLEVSGEGLLRPGMFSNVSIETATRTNALVIPRSALALDSITDAVFVVDGDTAARREIQLGYREGDRVEVLGGLGPDDRVIVLGQDGLSDGTPVNVLDAAPPGDDDARPPEARRPAPGMRPDIESMTPEQLERIKERMRERGLSDKEIEERLRRGREAGR